MKTTSNDSAGSIGFPGACPAQLLISVRSDQEMDAAIAGGADIVDLKEPRNGALAPTTVQLWRSAADRVGDAEGLVLSAALGESSQAVDVASSLPIGFRFAKVGPSQCDSAIAIQRLWTEVRQLLDPSIELVAVAYADHQASECLQPESIFSLAAEFGLSRCLIDTYVKDGRSTIDHLGLGGVARLSEISRQKRIWWALAGSIRLDDVIGLTQQMKQADITPPHCYGVRGDVCDNGRGGRLLVDRVREWKASSLIQTNQVPLSS